MQMGFCYHCGAKCVGVYCKNHTDVAISKIESSLQFAEQMVENQADVLFMISATLREVDSHEAERAHVLSYNLSRIAEEIKSLRGGGE